MKKLLSATAFAICALFNMTTLAVDLPSWAIGTWGGSGRYTEDLTDEGEPREGLYKLTLSATSVREEYKFYDKEPWGYTDAWNDVKITDQSDCHLVLSFQDWSNSHAQNMVLCKEGCCHYETSYYSPKVTDDDTENKNELTKLEMNTAPAEGWPEWVIGTWGGSLSVYVPDKKETFIGACTLTVSDSGTTAKCVFEGDDEDDGLNEEMNGFVITDKANCHIAGTCWYWNDGKSDWYDMNFIFRNTACSHNVQSSCKFTSHLGDSDMKETGEVTNLKKDGGDPTPSMSTIEWPSWVLGTWSGAAVNVVDGGEETYTGSYTLTLSSSGSEETYAWNDGTDDGTGKDNLKGWEITEKKSCHVLATCWYSSDSGEYIFDAKFIFCNSACSHYVKSSFGSKMRIEDGDTVEVADLVKNGGTPAPSEPYVPGDDGATIEGDAEKGYTITPSSDEVVVTIPSGVSADKVTVKVSPEAKVMPNGANVMVMKGGHDIASYLDFPEKDASGMIDLSKATVKEEIVKEALSVEKGAEISLSPDKPVLTTPKTRSGLTYRLKEGTTLEAMKANTTGASTMGDGDPWTPTITVSGGSSAFYTIEVTK